LLGGGFVGAEREVADQEGPARAARDGARVRHHVVQSHGQRRVVAVHDHADRVADEEDVDAGGVDLFF
jgi:hypothetical protein